MNPFAQLTLLSVQDRRKRNISPRQLASLLDAPQESSAVGVRDRALLQLLSEGLYLHQLHNIDLKDIDTNAQSLIVSTRSGDQELFLLKEPTWTRLERWMIICKLFAVNTEAVFISLHWTAGRAQPGLRLSERGMRAIITKYLVQIGIKQAGVNSRLITKSAHAKHSKIQNSF